MVNIRSSNAWVTYIDVWGFSHAVEHTPQQELHQRLSEVVRACAERLSSDPGSSPTTFFFSDSLFLAFEIPRCGSTLQAFDSCRDRTQEVIQIYLDHGFHTRGGIAFGEVGIAEGILVGAPVVRAARCEKMITAPLVILPAKEIRQCFGDNSPLRAGDYTIVPTRGGGLIRAHVVHAVNKEEQIDQMRRLQATYLLEGPDLSAAALQVALSLLKNGSLNG